MTSSLKHFLLGFRKCGSLFDFLDRERGGLLKAPPIDWASGCLFPVWTQWKCRYSQYSVFLPSEMTHRWDFFGACLYLKMMVMVMMMADQLSSFMCLLWIPDVRIFSVTISCLRVSLVCGAWDYGRTTCCQSLRGRRCDFTLMLQVGFGWNLITGRVSGWLTAE